MRGHKTPAVAYITRLIYTTAKPDFCALLERSPLTRDERCIVTAYAEGERYKELADRYHITTQAIYWRKRKAYEKLHKYIVNTIYMNCKTD